MPIKKTARKLKKTEETKKDTLQVEVLHAETAQPSDTYKLALARVGAVMLAKVGSSNGTISAQRADHNERWTDLLSQDQFTREQILELKQKENQILGLITDKVVGNLIETIDSAVEQGILEAPEEV